MWSCQLALIVTLALSAFFGFESFLFFGGLSRDVGASPFNWIGLS
jgi:hypothetical protein